MKQLFYSIAVFIIVSFTSCEKEYTCVCSHGYITKTYEEVTIKANDEDNARNKCRDKTDLSSQLAGHNCSLKE